MKMTTKKRIETMEDADLKKILLDFNRRLRLIERRLDGCPDVDEVQEIADDRIDYWVYPCSRH